MKLIYVKNGALHEVDGVDYATCCHQLQAQSKTTYEGVMVSMIGDRTNYTYEEVGGTFDELFESSFEDLNNAEMGLHGFNTLPMMIEAIPVDGISDEENPYQQYFTLPMNLTAEEANVLNIPLQEIYDIDRYRPRCTPLTIMGTWSGETRLPILGEFYFDEDQVHRCLENTNDPYHIIKPCLLKKINNMQDQELASWPIE